MFEKALDRLRQSVENEEEAAKAFEAGEITEEEFLVHVKLTNAAMEEFHVRRP